MNARRPTAPTVGSAAGQVRERPIAVDLRQYWHFGSKRGLSIPGAYQGLCELDGVEAVEFGRAPVDVDPMRELGCAVTGTPSTTPSSPTAPCSSTTRPGSANPAPWGWTRRCSAARARGGASAGRPPSSTSPAGRLLDVVAGRSAARAVRWLAARGEERCKRIAWATLDLRSLPVGVRHDAARRHPDRRSVPSREAGQHQARRVPPAGAERDPGPSGATSTIPCIDPGGC